MQPCDWGGRAAALAARREVAASRVCIKVSETVLAEMNNR